MNIKEAIAPSRASLDAIYEEDAKRRAEVLAAIQTVLTSERHLPIPRWQRYSMIYDSCTERGVTLDDIRHAMTHLCDRYQVWSFSALNTRPSCEILTESYEYCRAAGLE